MHSLVWYSPLVNFANISQIKNVLTIFSLVSTNFLDQQFVALNKHPRFCCWLCLFVFNFALELFFSKLAVTHCEALLPSLRYAGLLNSAGKDFFVSGEWKGEEKCWKNSVNTSLQCCSSAISMS